VPDRWRNKINYQETVLKIIEDDNNFHDYLGKAYLDNKDEKLKKFHSYHSKRQDSENLNQANNLNNNNSNHFLNSNNYNNFNSSEGFKSTFRERKRMEASMQNLFSIKNSIKTVNVKDKNNLMLKLTRMETFVAQKTNPNISVLGGGAAGSVADSIGNPGTTARNNEMNMSIKTTNSLIGSTSFKDTGFGGLKKHSKSKSLHTNPTESQFLNTYKLEKIELTNKNVKDLFYEVNKFGPNFQFCDKCNNKNLHFYKEMRTENAVKLLNHIKQFKKEHKLVI